MALPVRLSAKSTSCLGPPASARRRDAQAAPSLPQPLARARRLAFGRRRPALVTPGGGCRIGVERSLCAGAGWCSRARAAGCFRWAGVVHLVHGATGESDARGCGRGGPSRRARGAAGGVGGRAAPATPPGWAPAARYDRSYKVDLLERLPSPPELVIFGGSRAQRFEPSSPRSSPGCRRSTSPCRTAGRKTCTPWPGSSSGARPASSSAASGRSRRPRSRTPRCIPGCSRSRGWPSSCPAPWSPPSLW